MRRAGLAFAATVCGVLVSGCGGSSSPVSPTPLTPPPVSPPSVDDFNAQSNGLVDTSVQGIHVTARYSTMQDEERGISARELAAGGYGQLRRSRVVYRQAEGTVVADDYPGSLLEIPVTMSGTRIAIGEATREISEGCEVSVSHAIAVEGVPEQGELSFRHEETIAFMETGATGACADALNSVALRLMSTNEAEFPFDVITLLGLGAVSSTGLSTLEGWTLNHTQLASRWYRTIGDEEFELVAADQRLAVDVFAPVDDRAASFKTQLTP